MSAAPLKRNAGRSGDNAATRFRAHMSAAPLKLTYFALIVTDGYWFPRSHERGPSEAFVEVENRFATLYVSAPT